MNEKPFWDGGKPLIERFKERVPELVAQIDSHGAHPAWDMLTQHEKEHVVSMYMIAHEDVFGIAGLLFPDQ